MAIIRWKDRDVYDPWYEFKTLQKEINNLFDVDHFPTTTGLFDRNFSPAIDIAEDTNEYTIACELPGLNLNELDVSIASNVLTIKGERKYEDKKGKSYKRESWSGSFQRTLPLPVQVNVRYARI